MENKNKRKTIYDGINLSEKGRDITVIVLSVLLLICLIAAFLTAN